MAGYLTVEHRITDPAKFEDYRSKVGPMIAKHGERYLTKGGTHKQTTHWQPDRVAIIEFPNMMALEAWYSSTEYQPAIALGKASVDMDKDLLITVEGHEAAGVISCSAGSAPMCNRQSSACFR